MHSVTQAYIQFLLPALPATALLATVHRVAVILVAESAALTDTLACLEIQIRALGTLAATNGDTRAVFLRIWLVVGRAFVLALTLTCGQVELCWIWADNVLGASTRTTGVVKCVWLIAGDVRALTVAGVGIVVSRWEAAERLASWLALTVTLVGEVKLLDTDRDPHLDPPTVELLVADGVEIASACLCRLAVMIRVVVLLAIEPTTTGELWLRVVIEALFLEDTDYRALLALWFVGDDSWDAVWPNDCYLILFD